MERRAGFENAKIFATEKTDSTEPHHVKNPRTKKTTSSLAVDSRGKRVRAREQKTSFSLIFEA
jgi:hypothetical protein